MKKTLLVSFICTSFLFSNGQDFQVKDIQLSPLSVFHTIKRNDNFSAGGLHIGVDIGFELFKQDLRFQLNTGSDVNILGTSDNSFRSANLLYELNPKIFSWVETNFYGGLGLNYVSFTRNNAYDIDNTYLNVPLGTRFIFLADNRISFGLQFQTDFNYDNTTLIYSTVVRYNFKNKSKTAD